MTFYLNNSYTFSFIKGYNSKLCNTNQFAKCFNFDNKTALVCDTDSEKPVLEKIHKDEKDIMIFSIEELFRCIPNDSKEEAGSCIFTGKPSTKKVLFAKAY